MAVGITRVVHEPRDATTSRRIHKLAVFKRHEVEVALAHLRVLFCALDKGCLRQDLANVLNDERVSFVVEEEE